MCLCVCICVRVCVSVCIGIYLCVVLDMEGCIHTGMCVCVSVIGEGVYARMLGMQYLNSSVSTRGEDSKKN